MSLFEIKKKVAGLRPSAIDDAAFGGRVGRKLKRFILRWRWMREYEASLNRRGEVEQELLDVANGKRPLPDIVQCRQWATRLGVPDKWREAT